MTSAAPRRPLALLLLALVACAVACIAVSSQSLWIDEAEVANITNHPSLLDYCRAFNNDHTSNMQAPLYFTFIWAWARLFGESEFSLHAANLPFFFLGLFAINHFLRRHAELRNATLLLYCLHPFVWYYMDEARPYHMQLAGSLLAMGCLFAALDVPEEPLPASWWWCFGVGLVILCGASFVGVPWAMGITLLLIRRPGFWGSLRRYGLPALALCLPLLILLALYFAWTLEQNIRSGYLPMSIGSSLAIFYEQFGFLGLGPGRTLLREASVSATLPYLVPLALLGLPLAWGFIAAARRRFGLSRANLTAILLVAGGSLFLILAFGFLHHARILARHLTPLFPFILVAEAYSILLLWKGGRLAGRAAAMLTVIALALSSIEIRFAFRHSKDDYRSAAAAAKQALAEGKTVWWAADRDGAKYYHLPFAYSEQPGMAFWIDHVPQSFSRMPDDIFLSKPDLFDPTHVLVKFIASNHYQPAATFQSFTVWEKPQPPQ